VWPEQLYGHRLDRAQTLTMRVFISYRRRDSGGHLPEIQRVLKGSTIRGEACELFVDVNALSLGRDYVDGIASALKTSDVALVLVGRHWLVENGVRRIDEAQDPVRLEIRAAISTKTPLVAVLVDGASMPPDPELPADIREIARAQAVELRYETFDQDLAALVSTIGGFPSRSPHAPAPATLRLVNEATAWLASGDQYYVYVDDRKVGLLVSGSGPTEFVLPPGRHSVRVQRGLRRSETVTVTLKPGQPVPLGYEIGIWKISLRNTAGG
jgi:hypothetical protein